MRNPANTHYKKGEVYVHHFPACIIQSIEGNVIVAELLR